MSQNKADIRDQFYQEYFWTRFPRYPRRQQVWKQVAAYIQKRYIPKDSKILELGSGYCEFINNIQGSQKCAVDVFTRLPEFADPDVITRIQNCTDLSCFTDSSFDVVFASNLFEHLTRDELLDTLSETRRVLRYGGWLILLQPNFKYCFRTYFDGYTHLQIFTDASIYDLLEMAGLRIRDLYPKFLPVNMKSTLRLKLPYLGLLVWLYLRLPYKPLAGQMLVVAENRSSGS